MKNELTNEQAKKLLKAIFEEKDENLEEADELENDIKDIAEMLTEAYKEMKPKEQTDE